jgi:serine/threonine protein kinase
MPQQGQRVGEYVLEEPLGRGAFGEVWRARHHAWLDQHVAVKIPTDPQYLRNLQREGAAVQGLVHANVARAIAFDPYADPAYLATEYVPGSSLRPVIAAKSLTHKDAVAIMQQVLAGLSYAHGRGIVHRDVKPENILVHERAKSDGYAAEGVVKVTDFGLGRAASEGAAVSIAYSASMNDPKARDLAGTIDYMAPEVRGGAEADARADLYACGVVLYELLTGERPAGTDVPSDVNPNVSKQLDDVFRRAYARLEKRFTSADEFLAALSGQGAAPAPVRAMTTPTCPQCRKHVSFGDQFCMHCGIQLTATVRRCAKCGAYPDAADQHCIFCGETLAAQATVAR